MRRREGAHAHHVADHNHGGICDAGGFRLVGDGTERADRHALIRQIAVLNDANWSVQRQTGTGQGGGGIPERGHAHQQDDGVVRAGRDLGEFLMPGDHAKALGQAAVRHGDAGGGGNGDRGRDAGDDFNLDAVLPAVFGFLAATAQDVGVAALEPDHAVAFECFFDEDAVDLGLRYGMVAGVFPTSMTRTSGASSLSSSRGPRRSATTTSAWPRSRRPRTVMRPVSPGPPPTRATEPADARRRRSGRSPVSRAVATASRRAMARRGSPRRSRRSARRPRLRRRESMRLKLRGRRR